MFAGISLNNDFSTKINITFDPEDMDKKEQVINDIVGFPFCLDFKNKAGSMRFYLCHTQLERLVNLGLQALQEHDRVRIERDLC